MAATSLKLPDELKRRIATLANESGKTPHAFMVETLAREAERLELRAQFAAEAEAAEKDAMRRKSGIPLAAAFDYLDNRLAGGKAKRPRARRWRASN